MSRSAGQPRTVQPFVYRRKALAEAYGRTLAYVYKLTDGVFVNLTLARNGFAMQATFPPNVASTPMGTGSPASPVERRSATQW